MLHPSRLTALLVLFATTAPVLAQETGAAAPPFRKATRLGTLPVKAIPEASGLVRSRRYPDVFWTHNDSGGAAEIFAVHADGTLVRRVRIRGADNVDWEDLALDSQNRLIVADIGDNYRAHAEFVLYRFAEPDPAGSEAVSDIETYRCCYPPGVGAVDAEALFVCGDDAFVVTKEAKIARLFRLSLPGQDNVLATPIVAELVGEFEDLAYVTSASLSDNGRHLAILTFVGVAVIDLEQAFRPELPAAELLATLQQAPRRQQRLSLGQCEGVTFDGPDLVLASERGPFAWGKPALWRLTPK